MSSCFLQNWIFINSDAIFAQFASAICNLNFGNRSRLHCCLKETQWHEFSESRKRFRPLVLFVLDPCENGGQLTVNWDAFTVYQRKSTNQKVRVHLSIVACRTVAPEGFWDIKIDEKSIIVVSCFILMIWLVLWAFLQCKTCSHLEWPFGVSVN